MIKSANPQYKILELYKAWKEAAICGVKYALTRINHTDKVEIRFIDLNGHPAHSNLYSMFAAGFLCTFEVFEIELKQSDLEKLYDFVASSVGIEKIHEQPDPRKLEIEIYNH